jgi:hypothetical protein
MGVFGARRLWYGTIGTGFEAVQSRDGRGGLGNMGGMGISTAASFSVKGLAAIVDGIVHAYPTCPLLHHTL